MPIVNNIRVDNETLSNLVKFLLDYGIDGKVLPQNRDPWDFYRRSVYYVLVYNHQEDSYYYKLSPYALQILNYV